MKSLEQYMKMPYRMEIVEDRYEGGYVVSFPELPGCLTCGDTIEEAIRNAEDAKLVWLEAAIEDGLEIQEPGDINRYSGQFKLRIPKSLHKTLAENAKQEGVSMNQYCVYLLSQGQYNGRAILGNGNK
jgi:predicted RNase H-like HicB family nuclease